ncbi:MAG: hypothetical protein KC587_18505 [Nitrospira sp.]|nr:hypothetical protein [Nitrospira sp.]MCA9458663.1 hypothetical protein [Nitrospira sp.]MCW5782079.1 hypothetical protein [Nitrospirales bacterium]
MPSTYFSDREPGHIVQVPAEVLTLAWGSLVALIEGFIANGGFGIDFPNDCPDGRGPTGTNDHNLGLAIRGEIPELSWPIRAEPVPPQMVIMDLLEFCHDHVAEPDKGSYHPFFDHHHLTFDRIKGQHQFRERVNKTLMRNKLAYLLKEDGTVSRLAPPVLHEALSSQMFNSGDDKLDQLLDLARTKFLDPDSVVRREALEKLWDAWERVKTLEPPANKRESTKALLDKAATEPQFRKLIENEARSLTDIGNNFHIRHSEIQQVEIQSEDQIDYLFHRLFALIWLILRAR